MKDCIICGNKLARENFEESYLKLDAYYCKECRLYSIGKSEEEVKGRITELYEGEFWGASTENAINSNFTDTDSQGKKGIGYLNFLIVNHIWGTEKRF